MFGCQLAGFQQAQDFVKVTAIAHWIGQHLLDRFVRANQKKPTALLRYQQVSGLLMYAEHDIDAVPA